ncbi:hypothetical protein ACOMHN_014003 [Nucella lapillus]
MDDGNSDDEKHIPGGAAKRILGSLTSLQRQSSRRNIFRGELRSEFLAVLLLFNDNLPGETYSGGSCEANSWQSYFSSTTIFQEKHIPGGAAKRILGSLTSLQRQSSRRNIFRGELRSEFLAVLLLFNDNLPGETYSGGSCEANSWQSYFSSTTIFQEKHIPGGAAKRILGSLTSLQRQSSRRNIFRGELRSEFLAVLLLFNDNPPGETYSGGSCEANSWQSYFSSTTILQEKHIPGGAAKRILGSLTSLQRQSSRRNIFRGELRSEFLAVLLLFNDNLPGETYSGGSCEANSWQSYLSSTTILQEKHIPGGAAKRILGSLTSLQRQSSRRNIFRGELRSEFLAVLLLFNDNPPGETYSGGSCEANSWQSYFSSTTILQEKHIPGGAAKRILGSLTSLQRQSSRRNIFRGELRSEFLAVLLLFNDNLPGETYSGGSCEANSWQSYFSSTTIFQEKHIPGGAAKRILGSLTSLQRQSSRRNIFRGELRSEFLAVLLLFNDNLPGETYSGGSCEANSWQSYFSSTTIFQEKHIPGELRSEFLAVLLLFNDNPPGETYSGGSCEANSWQSYFSSTTILQEKHIPGGAAKRILGSLTSLQRQSSRRNIFRGELRSEFLAVLLLFNDNLPGETYSGGSCEANSWQSYFSSTTIFQEKHIPGGAAKRILGSLTSLQRQSSRRNIFRGELRSEFLAVLLLFNDNLPGETYSGGSCEANSWQSYFSSTTIFQEKHIPGGAAKRILGSLTSLQRQSSRRNIFRGELRSEFLAVLLLFNDNLPGETYSGGSCEANSWQSYFSSTTIFQEKHIPGGAAKRILGSMSIADLTTWLHSRPPCPKVKHLFLHVGLNSCSSGQISVNTWTKLMILCKKVFPSSTLALSSIIPAKGRHNLNNAIAPSNSNLHKACQLLDVAIIDNTSSFVAPSGAPRLALYRDPFHPSVQGTAKLAVSMKKMLANWQPDHFWRSDPGRSDRRNWPQANHHASLLPAQDSAIREQ